MQESASHSRARWIRDFSRFLPIKSQFVLSGNVRDLQIMQDGTGGSIPTTLNDTLDAELKLAGYGLTLRYDVVSGFSVSGRSEAEIIAGDALMTEIGLSPQRGRAPAGLDLLAAVLEPFVSRQGEPTALIVDFASRLVVRRDSLSGPEHQLFTRSLILSHQSKPRPWGVQNRPFYNTVLWVVEREADLPDWLIIDNPKLRHISISKPDHSARGAIASSLLSAMPGARDISAHALRDVRKIFVDETEGLLLSDLKSIILLGAAEQVPIMKIADAVRRYKVGVTEDPWQKIERDRIRGAEGFIRDRVKGQSHAITHMLDIIKRAITGVGAGRRAGRPRGVVFLAGPTGVGKTELAKTVTSLLFNDENAYIRFDMSEFSAEHSDQRLIGAPPGYIGHDAGGELTNAIRERPFSVVLFDEIEKAHPRILDKFLQILDDGVLTSGRGDRVYFSEAFIIFTSNLGIYKVENERSVQNVTLNDSFEAVESKVLAEIKSHFKFKLNRPEILNRIGENIVVFDFIRPIIADQIFDQIIDEIVSALAQQDLDVTISPSALSKLKEVCLADLSNGGRGIRNQIEAHLTNPLARALFDADMQPGGRLEIAEIRIGNVTTLILRERN